MSDLKKLIEEARWLVSVSPGAQQVIVLRTASGKVCHFANTCVGAYSEEDRFLDLLRKTDDPVAEAMVCMWHDYQLDVPSMHFRKALLALNPGNAAAMLPLQGENYLVVKRLGELV